MMAAQVDAVLAQTLGPGKAQVLVNADLNDNQATQQSLTYTSKAVPLTRRPPTRRSTGGNPSAGGATGDDPRRRRHDRRARTPTTRTTPTNTTYGVNKTITHSTIAPGAINRQSVSVLVNSTVPGRGAADDQGRGRRRGRPERQARRHDLGLQLPFAKPTDHDARGRAARAR